MRRARDPSRSHRATLVVLVLVIASLATAARADSAIEARFFDARAREAFARHQYPRALALFVQSHVAAPSPGSAYNVAVCAMRAGDDALAYAMLSEVVEGEMDDAARLADARARLDSLRPRLALIRVESDPPGASIEVDRAALGSFGVTPRTIAVSPGEHVLRLYASGRSDATSAVVVARGEEARVALALPAQTGTLAITTTTPDTSVIVFDADGREVSSGLGPFTLPIGVYRVRAAAAEHTASDLVATITSGAETALRVALTPAPAPRGRFLCSTAGVTARVTVDGQDVGVTPIALDLREGEHDVAVQAEGRRSWRSVVHVTATQSSYLDLVLVPGTP